MPETVTEWYDIRTNIADLAASLLDEGWGTDEVVEMIRRPWKYTDEYMEMRKVDPA